MPTTERENEPLAADPGLKPEDSLTPAEFNLVVQGALEIFAEGLDTPDAHLEYCRGRLRAALA